MNLYSISKWKRQSISLFFSNEKFKKQILSFLSAFYLIMWLMKASKNFEKIFISKIWELVFIWGVKTHFGLLPSKWSIFIHEKKYFNQYYALALDPIWLLTYQAPQHDHLDLSFRKDCHVFGKAMTKNGKNMAIYES